MFRKLRNIIYRIRAFRDWYKLIYPFNKLFTKGTSLYLRGWGKVWIRNPRLGDPFVFINVITLDEYEVANFSIPPGGRVLDIGANIGAFGILIKKHFPTAQIEAYEPHPSNFQLLQKNAPFAKNIEKAVAGKSGVVNFSIAETYTSTRVSEEGNIRVEAISFKEVLQKYETLDLLKIDIEGGEFDIFDSLQPQDLNSVRSLVMEVHGNNKEKIDGLLRKIEMSGFAINWINPILLMAVR